MGGGSISVGGGLPGQGITNVAPQIVLQPGVLSGAGKMGEAWNYFLYVSYPHIDSLTLPHFADQQISAVSNPNGWVFEIGNSDVFGLGQGAGFMRWTYDGVTVDALNVMISYRSPWGAGLGPVRFTQSGLSTNLDSSSGYFQPGSPLALAAGITSFSTPVPLPSALIPFAGVIFSWMFSVFRGRKAGVAAVTH